MADNQILFETIIEGLSNQKRSLDDLIIEHDALKNELLNFQDQYSKDYKLTQDRLDNVSVQIDKTIKDAISKIEIPSPISEDEITNLIKQYIVDEAKLKQDLKTYIDEKIPEPKEAKDGQNGTDGKDGLNGKDGLDGQDGKDGAKGERGLIGQDGQKGSDGVGIEDIKRDNEDLVVTLTDDTEKRIKLPSQQKFYGGVSGTSLQNATSVQIVSTAKDIQLVEQSQSVLVDASSGDVNVTLPNPVNCFFGGRSYIIGVSRTDLSANVANILPFGSELILNEASQDLLSREVINLITNGTNWYYYS